MRLAKALLGGIALSALAACTAPLEELREAGGGQGSAFTQALADGYRAFAESEAAQYDWIDSRTFAKKGLAAARGVVVAPEQPADWSIKIERPDTLAQARTRLVTALDAGGRDRLPQAAAKAQVGYDCWLEQLEEGWQHDDIAACRKQFETALAELEGARPPTAASGPAAPALADSVDRYQVYFDFASAQLTPIAHSIVAEAVAAAKQAGADKLVVVGHADRAGSAEANLVLSARRAEAVKRALLRLGVAAAAVETLALGESEPLVATPDDVREPYNRRAVIRFR